jgi:hypothetical protein
VSGGPSHAHTFDLKPGGHYQPIDTSVPGIQISEYLPKVAQQMHHLALLRSMSAGDNNHTTAHYLMRTSFRQGAGGIKYPHFGAVAASELVREQTGMPNFVVLKPGSGSTNGCGGGHLGAGYAPLILKDVARGIENLAPAGEMAAFDRRAALLDQVDREFLRDYQAESIKAHRTVPEKAVQLMHLEKASTAFKLELEPWDWRERCARESIACAVHRSAGWSCQSAPVRRGFARMVSGRVAKPRCHTQRCRKPACPFRCRATCRQSVWSVRRSPQGALLPLSPCDRPELWAQHARRTAVEQRAPSQDRGEKMGQAAEPQTPWRNSIAPLIYLPARSPTLATRSARQGEAYH